MAIPPPNVDTGPATQVPRSYAWIVFALTFGLLISDYMSRQVLNAVFPLLKADWQLTDAQLGSPERGGRAHGRAADLLHCRWPRTAGDGSAA